MKKIIQETIEKIYYCCDQCQIEVDPSASNVFKLNMNNESSYYQKELILCPSCKIRNKHHLSQLKNMVESLTKPLYNIKKHEPLPESAFVPTYVLIGGKAGSGKDTIAKYLIDKYRFTRFAFADPVKKVAIDIFNVSPEYQHYFYTHEYKELQIPGYKLSAREMTQIIGDGIRHITYPTIWCENLDCRIREANLEIARVVITDLRYTNESTYFDNKYGKSLKIRLIKDGCDGKVGIPDHPSETEEYSTQYEISNNGTLEQLYDQIDVIFKKENIVPWTLIFKQN